MTEQIVSKGIILKRNNYNYKQCCLYCNQHIETKAILMITPGGIKDLKSIDERMVGNKVFPKLHVNCFEPWIKHTRKVIKKKITDIISDFV